MKFVYFHSLYGDMTKFERVRKIVVDEKADMVICGGDFYKWESGFVEKYMEIVQEIINGKRYYVQCFGDQDNPVPFMDEKYKSIEKFVIAMGSIIGVTKELNIVGLPWTCDPRFKYKHFYRSEDDDSAMLGVPKIFDGTKDEDFKDLPLTMKDEIETSGVDKLINPFTLVVSHNPPMVPHPICKDINLINRGSHEIFQLIKKTAPWMVLTGHTTNQVLENSGANYVYDIPGSDITVVNPSAPYAFVVEIKKNKYYYHRRLI